MKALLIVFAVAAASLASSASATHGLAPASSTATVSLAGTWRSSMITGADANATLRRHRLGKWITRFGEQGLFAEPIALILVLRPGDWDLYGKPNGKPRFAIDYDAEWHVNGRTVDKIHATGVTTFRWSVSGGVLRLRWLRTTEPPAAGIPDEVYQRALYMTRGFTRQS
jgi:hypothetical protein